MDAPIFAPIIRTAPPSPSLDVPRVMRRARGLVRAHPFSLLAATLVFNAAPEVAVNAIHLDPSLSWMATLGVFSLTTIGSSVLGSFFVGWAALTLADDQGGRRNVSGFEVWKRLVVMGPSLILTALIFWLAVSFATVLIVVPGVILAAAWTLCVPAVVVERLSPLHALVRSAAITRGRRWPIVGLMGAVILVSGAIIWLGQELVGARTVLVFGTRAPLYADILHPILAGAYLGMIGVVIAAIFVETAPSDRSAALSEVFS